jgi:hypothetical protein
MRRLFEAFEEGLGGHNYFFLGKILGEVVGVRFVDHYLEEGSTKTIHYAMYLERYNIYLKIGYDG